MTNSISSHILRNSQRGFSLLELSIALVVIGIVVAGGLSMSTSMVDRQAYVQTGNQMDEVDKAIAAYVAVNKRLPCPSRPALSLSDANFGKEKANCKGTAASDSMQRVAGTGGRNVWIGGLPVRTLGLRDRYAADEYGNRYTYAVTENLTNATDYASDAEADKGAIIVKDDGGNNIVEDAAYTFVSHGGDSKGAYRYETASQNVTCSGGLDALNCDHAAGASFRDTRFNRGSVAGNWFDDTVRFTRREVLNLRAGGANSGGTQLWATNGDHIYNTNSQNVGVGTANPGGKFAVQGVDGENATLRIDGGEGAFRVLDINTMLGETGINLVTKGTTRAMRIDHVGDGGTGIDLSMNNENSTGINLYFPGGAVNSTGINIDNTSTGTDLTTGININGVIYGLKVNIESGLGHAVYATSSQDHTMLLRAQYTGEMATGLGINSTGRGSNGVKAIMEGNTSTAIWGVVQDETSFGVRGQASGQHSMGVLGEAYDEFGVGVRAWSANGAGIEAAGKSGVLSTAEGTENGTAAISGNATGNTGTTYGGYFENSSSSGYGVYAAAKAGPTAATYAGYFTNVSRAGTAVYGGITATSGFASAARFETASATGTGLTATGGMYGVRGDATAAGTTTHGGYFTSTSTSGYGVVGAATAGSGTTYGVYGSSASTAGYGVWCQGSKCGGSVDWTYTSDMRLKDNITTLDDAHGLDAIRKLRPVTYTWKDIHQKEKGTQIGFIAQEVEKIFPEAIKTAGDQKIDLGGGKKETITQTKSMSGTTLISPLVRAVQQLADKLDSLFESLGKLLERVNGHDAKITALEAENAALKARLDALEAKLAK